MPSMLTEKRLPLEPPIDLGCGIVVDEAVFSVAATSILTSGDEERSPLFTVSGSKEAKQAIKTLIYGSGPVPKNHGGLPKIHEIGRDHGLIRKDNERYTVVSLSTLRKPETMTARIIE